MSYFRGAMPAQFGLKAKRRYKMSERLNSRKNNELRGIKFTRNYTKHALSSVLAEFGDTKVIVTASVDEKAPKWMEKDDPRGWITAEV